MQVKNKDLIKIRDVPKLLLELTGAGRTRITVYQWVRYGRESYAGEKIYLKTVRRLGYLYTTRKWVEEFIRSLG